MTTTLARSSVSGKQISPLLPRTPLFQNNKESSRSLVELIRESQTVLFRFHTQFPFDPFPDEIIIDETKINIISKSFFMTYHIHSVMINDITDVSVDTGLLFASLHIIDSSNYRYPIEITIHRISKRNAFTARKIIQGLISTHRKNISLAHLTTRDVMEDVNILGQTQGKDISDA